MPKSKPRKKPTTSPIVRKKRSFKKVAGILVVIGIAVAGYFGFSEEPNATYLPEDVVRERPIRAVHEMGSGPRIPFLPEDQAQPRIEIPRDSYNAGRVGSKDIVTKTFVIRNDGDAPLTISRAFTTCGCTTAKITGRVIPPGKVALAHVRFDVGFHDARGQTVQRGLIIESNDRKSSRTEMWLHASVSSY